jgi:hypothetical protein
MFFPNPQTRVASPADATELFVTFDDHAEHLYLGDWTRLTVGNLRLTRRPDGTVEARELDDLEDEYGV